MPKGPDKEAATRRRPTPSIDAAAAERLISEFAPIIRYLAQRLVFRLPPSLDVEDLIHAGVIGLMDAIGKYDPSREARFRTYAEFRIRGAMLDEIRSLDWMPRSVREKITLFQRTLEKLSKELGRAPSEEEIAAALEMDAAQFDAFLFQAKGISLLHLEDVGLEEGDERRFIESLADLNAENPLLSLLAQGLRDRLVQAIDHLPQKERQVISLYYFDELTMKEIGQVLKVTESRVCQLHAQAIGRLKGALAEKKE
ncbi:MAG: FliA/WhiG family RNA polymerase sigma factor [Candidatus Manganitrophus sp.]|nr:FliA/WhiG family RNA polymerase sigma factor [Candidatus Manganitrophus sp.]WDT72414.1 MAG: FliA/WhiG family RNA polymerase sigma factor [Candidatus Manganitrophus sp.]WDT75345.1 MAG: FliA/WhiG family RNA polymerase sigma factor [Candidatus Manganitrophus sp.]